MKIIETKRELLRTVNQNRIKINYLINLGYLIQMDSHNPYQVLSPSLKGRNQIIKVQFLSKLQTKIFLLNKRITQTQMESTVNQDSNKSNNQTDQNQGNVQHAQLNHQSDQSLKLTQKLSQLAQYQFEKDKQTFPQKEGLISIDPTANTASTAQSPEKYNNLSETSHLLVRSEILQKSQPNNLREISSQLSQNTHPKKRMLARKTAQNTEDKEIETESENEDDIQEEDEEEELNQDEQDKGEEQVLEEEDEVEQANSSFTEIFEVNTINTEQTTRDQILPYNKKNNEQPGTI
ncbi:UNKNOWN [Stylonychia lemnae]|uniref:Uncharacterized protein n=1 Tax=Stylonychia lemnae TaxID=5949 RepID=A0A078AVM2_STYLE|nr:UNKNOWN [Stylonychia lemnae]|eukprot:CDW84868.1 UNKNOWN [Stylonychia lemnae]